jgi:undecaprenyl diphosphate synthase
MATTPVCVGIIMDGNRRWAKERSLPSLAGHQEGFKNAIRIVRHAFSRPVDTIILYAFSTENWNRAPEEVGYLMELFSGALMKELRELAREGHRIRFIGERSRLAEKLRAAMAAAEADRVRKPSGKTLVVALSYGGRAEIVAAANALLAEQKEHASEADFARVLFTADIPDPDLVIRTGREMRLSNFLPWQSVYSELFFSDSYWPDFGPEEFDTILAAYAARERRRGK